MTIAELIFALQKFPNDAQVYVEYNESGGGYVHATAAVAQVLEGENVVIITSGPD